MQNTVQAFLRTMEQKRLVTHRTEGRTFVYRPTVAREPTSRSMLAGLLDRAFDGALDRLVASALSLRRPKEAELMRLRALLDDAATRTDRKRRAP